MINSIYIDMSDVQRDSSVDGMRKPRIIPAAHDFHTCSYHGAVSKLRY